MLGLTPHRLFPARRRRPGLEARCSEEDGWEAERVRKTRVESCKKQLQRFAFSVHTLSSSNHTSPSPCPLMEETPEVPGPAAPRASTGKWLHLLLALFWAARKPRRDWTLGPPLSRNARAPVSAPAILKITKCRQSESILLFVEYGGKMFEKTKQIQGKENLSHL